ncbi:hypothetical protein [Actinokineospora sp. NBRC 105648]|uniref:hypothetical protein n=1 Tax=Actinokineospora sp. NBRC 105648 TaxID=3032206 RepID=UPI0024A4F64C|nr:hypothetical protein [Actinokineospora sp. NBRC 105648]GLZ41049.1 hypothetical protein Acsp05_46730 [Actinokineospora sp. NBRC 105648]
MRAPRVFTALLRLVDRFEERGVFVPGEDDGAVSPWKDFGWLIAAWLFAIGVLVLFFALAA